MIGAGRAPAGVGGDTPTLYAHPFSSYCQKVLTAFYETGVPFAYRRLSHDDAAVGAELRALWPIGKFPVLVDRGAIVAEASVIVEYYDLVSALRSRPARRARPGLRLSLARNAGRRSV